MILQQEQWRALQEQYFKRVQPWIEPRMQRRRQGLAHPVDDFLFEYYPYSPTRLATWHPGYGVVLQGPGASAFLRLSGYRAEGTGVAADLAWLDARRDRLRLAIRILQGTSSRRPMTGCYALHEWAMVYRLPQDQVRHALLPLRLAPSQVEQAVQSIGLRCTHIDAYRFFTPDAIPLNALEPTRGTQPDTEQPGCLHANMDLYKYAMWFQPMIGSDLVADCFEVARKGRNLDMQASPYDVSPFGLEPIRVETPEGRHEYAAEQRLLMEAANPLRTRLAHALISLRSEAQAQQGG